MDEDITKRLVFINTQFSRNVIEEHEFAIDKFITTYENNIILNNIDKKKPIEIIGQYYINEFNIKLSKYFNKDVIERLKKNSEVYGEFYDLLKNNQKDLYDKYNKVLFVTNIILKDEYKNKNITHELVEHLYRSLYTDNTLIIFLVKPIQLLHNTFFYYRAIKEILIKKDVKGLNLKSVSANKYFNLDGLVAKYKDYDMEKQTYKLFNIAKNAGLKKIIDTNNLFYLHEDSVLKNIKI